MNYKIILSSFVFLIFLFLITVFTHKGLVLKHKLEKQLIEIKKENEKLEKENNKLGKEIFLLKNNPLYIEKIVKEKLGLTRKDEIVYIINN